jgi:uncharacterized protein YggE
MKRLSLVAALLLAAAALAGIARPDGSHAAGTPATDTQPTITVSGNGSATSVPTRASISFGVQTQAVSAKAALAENADTMQQVLDALKKAGAQDIQTQSVSLTQTFGDNSQVTGYVANNTVTATVSYSAAGTTIDAAVAAGANQVDGPSPLVSDVEAQYQKALADAVANARARGEVLAKAAGERLGSAITVVEGSTAPLPVPFAAKAAAVDSAPTPVVAGPQETDATVTVTFALS